MFTAVVALVVLASSSPAAPAWTETEYRPVQDSAYTLDLETDGHRNGYMPAVRMIGVQGCLLERDAAYAFALMSEAARADGVDLDPQECYRSFDAQQAAYDRRCPEEIRQVTTLDPATGEIMLVSNEKVRNCSGPPTAKPGNSNHGWGRAIDFARGRRSLGCGDEAFRWLKENAAAYGWVHPTWAQCGKAGEEPWHWEWGGVEEVPPILSGLAFQGWPAFPIPYDPNGPIR